MKFFNCFTRHKIGILISIEILTFRLVDVDDVAVRNNLRGLNEIGLPVVVVILLTVPESKRKIIKKVLIRSQLYSYIHYLVHLLGLN